MYFRRHLINSNSSTYLSVITLWYFNGIAQNRQGYSDAVKRKNELTQPMVEHEISDKSWYTDNGEESFYNKTHIKEYVSHIDFIFIFINK